MKAEIIAVGTELLLGEILDTNSQYLSQQMSGLGIDLYYISHIGDNLNRLTSAVLQALDRSDLLIMTGGLGPTEDDLTREAIAAALGETMEVQPELENHLRTWYFRRNRPMPERNMKQATLIPSASTIPNPIGTAPGWWVETNGKVIATMPGVPVEMRKMWEEQILPRLQEIAGTGVIATRTLKTVGLGESAAEEVVQPLIRNTNPTLATYAKQDGVHLRMGAKAESRDAAEKLIDDFEVKVRELIGDWVYGYEDEALSAVVGKLMKGAGLTVGTMESCTGGLLASYFTDAPGSSAYFKGSLITYTPEMKIQYGVPREVVEKYGVVSEECARAMAQAVRLALGTDVGISTTGVAGPDPLEDKRPGTCFVAMDFQGEISVESAVWSTTRMEVKRRAVMDGLNMLWQALKARERAGV
jgi:nicotinamide-nucleotide amidase